MDEVRQGHEYVNDTDRGLSTAFPSEPRADIERRVAYLSDRDLLEFVRDVCIRFGAALVDVMSRDRHMSIARARHECWTALRDHSERSFSYPDIARMWDVDHTTVMAGVKKIRRLRVEEAERAAPAPVAPAAVPRPTHVTDPVLPDLVVPPKVARAVVSAEPEPAPVAEEPLIEAQPVEEPAHPHHRACLCGDCKPKREPAKRDLHGDDCSCRFCREARLRPRQRLGAKATPADVAKATGLPLYEVRELMAGGRTAEELLEGCS
jgi:hypothetical protein